MSCPCPLLPHCRQCIHDLRPVLCEDRPANTHLSTTEARIYNIILALDTPVPASTLQLMTGSGRDIYKILKQLQQKDLIQRITLPHRASRKLKQPQILFQAAPPDLRLAA